MTYGARLCPFLLPSRRAEVCWLIGDGALSLCVKECPVNQFPASASVPSNSGTCTDCPANSSSSAGAWSCKCNVGFRKTGTFGNGQLKTCTAEVVESPI